MKLEIEESRLKDPNLENPIDLKDLSCYKNKHGQWCVYFKTNNHKYLNVDYNTSTNCVNGNILPSGIMAHGLMIETHEEYNDGESSYDWPCHSLVIWMVPETKEESDELSGVAAILPTKWEYSVCVVKYDEFYEQSS